MESSELMASELEEYINELTTDSIEELQQDLTSDSQFAVVYSSGTNKSDHVAKSQNFEKKNVNWCIASIKLLLNEYEARKRGFEDGIIKKRYLWLQIASVLRKQGYNVDRLSAEKKFRNLNQTYLKVKKNKKTIRSRGRATWMYFEQFERIFNEDLSQSANLNVPKEPALQIERLNSSVTTNEGNFDAEVQSPPIKKFKNSNDFRSCMLEIETRKVQTLERLHERMMKNNEIQASQNNLIRKFINIFKKENMEIKLDVI